MPTMHYALVMYIILIFANFQEKKILKNGIVSISNTKMYYFL